MNDKRKELRNPAAWPGRIAFASGAQLRECTIRDISQSGARLTLADAQTLPRAFELLIVPTGEIFQATLQWRRGREAGVHFAEKNDFLTWPTAPRPFPDAPPPPAT